MTSHAATKIQIKDTKNQEGEAGSGSGSKYATADEYTDLEEINEQLKSQLVDLLSALQDT